MNEDGYASRKMLEGVAYVTLEYMFKDFEMRVVDTIACCSRTAELLAVAQASSLQQTPAH